jgi:Tol biopolymer transport system component
VSGKWPSDPDFFPNGRRIALGLGRRLALQEVAGGAPVVLPQLTDSDSDPYPSPDGRELVFSGRLAGQRDLFTVHVDGTGHRRLTRTGAASPTWSSRGEIAFSARKKIWRMRPGGKRSFVASGSRPDWSPSGNSLVYLYRRSIYRVPRRGGVRRRLVHGSALSAAFSSDGRSIAFGREVDIGGSLNTAMSSNGAGVKRIREGGEIPVGSTWLVWDAPAWQPGG